ncbi:MAG: DUF5611 family protein [Candidatus Methanomethylophilaceae archaeon]|nr:DUF5611 family protein [Candidatus Methanomethylophilaceae archaeon]
MDYDIKKGWFKNIEGDALAQLMNDVFGNVKKDGDKLISSYGVLEVIEVTVLGKDKLDIVTKNRDGPMTDDQILDSKRKLNVFAEKATGFDAKARMKRAQKKAKEGTL